MFKARLGMKFYIAAFLLFCLTALGWYGVYFLNSNVIYTDGSQMDGAAKTVLSAAIGAVLLSWTFSLIAMIRQIITGHAFTIDGSGIGSTVTAFMFLAFIFVVPVKNIPYSAIEKITVDKGITTLRLKKREIKTNPALLPFLPKEFHFFAGYTAEPQDLIKAVFDRHRPDAQDPQDVFE